MINTYKTRNIKSLAWETPKECQLSLLLLLFGIFIPLLLVHRNNKCWMNEEMIRSV